MAPASETDWQIKTVLDFLKEQFPGTTVDHSPRGRVAELFRVNERGQVLHQLYVTRKFLERARDGRMLLDSLGAVGVIGSMRNAGSVTVEVH